jgi:hypothetical protein
MAARPGLVTAWPGRRLALAGAMALTAVCWAGGAGAESEGPPAGQLLYLHDGWLWSVDATAATRPRRRADARGFAAPPAAPPAAPIDRLQSSPDGRLVALTSARGTAWVQLRLDDARAEPAELRAVAVAPCRGPGDVAPNGRALVCPGAAGTVWQPNLWIARQLPIGPAPVFFHGLAGDQLLVVEDNGIWAIPATGSQKRRPLAPHRPDRGFLPSPDGSRAVGNYETDGVSELWSFRLDGKAARRKLGFDLTAVAWSADSQWVLLPNHSRACVVRAVGGEYKCWEHFAGHALSPDGRHVLLGKDNALYIAPLNGVSAARPTRVVEQANGPATWVQPTARAIAAAPATELAPTARAGNTGARRGRR